MGMNVLMHAWDTLTKRMREVEWVSGAAKVSLASLLSGEDQVLGYLGTADADSEYETVGAGVSTPQVLGATGAVGDYLGTLIITVATAATAQVQIKDGSDTAITVLPNSPGGGIGVYVVKIGLRSRTGAWQVTTGAGSTVIAKGLFA